ncbi:conserved hypothetical protein [Histoplasma capsulatum H143]|uniref:Uncharacterized protein n=1 Tax=Ajellomyces capsulatus (strain H143) TaxID=544712 RepID=C6H231_AJECH|nr:conserved hypothetical protein [Histoplasma capsulatum H143]
MAEDSGQQKTPDVRILKKSTPSTQNMKSQKSILGFFQKSSPSASAASPARRNDASQEPVSSPAQRAASNQKSHKKPEPKLPRSLNTGRNKTVTSSGQSITPVPSSDATGYCEEDAEVEVSVAIDDEGADRSSVTPTRRAKKAVKSYLESDDDEDVLPINRKSSRRSLKRRKTAAGSSDEDEFKNDTEFSDDGQHKLYPSI